MMKSYQLFIDGKFQDSSHKQSLVNPSNGESFAQVAVADSADAQRAITAARRAFDKDSWKEISFAQRKEFLLKISQGILDRAGELAKLETLNTGKPIKETTFMDIPSAAKTFEYYALNLERYLQDETILVDNASGHLLRQPHGVVVLIVPWNYPLLIASWKMAQALACGNTVILKPSSLTPLTSLALGEIISEAGLPNGVVNIIVGSGENIGEQLCSDRNVDMISFTGSNSVGKKILGYAAKNVKKLIMELGGKSASIVLKDADIESAVNGSLCSIFLNQGQMCTAMSRIFVEDDIFDNFLKEFTAKAKRIKLGDGSDYETQMGPLISKEQRDKVSAFVQSAEREGAKILCGGKIPNSAELRKGFFFEPTVLTGVAPEMAIFKEEVFGPVVCISKFSTHEEAIELANASNFALASAVWSSTTALAEKLASRINAGVTWINTYGMFHNELPYGGFKQSGFGKELGREGLLEYSRLKNIIIDKTQNAKPLVNYWYGF